MKKHVNTLLNAALVVLTLLMAVLTVLSGYSAAGGDWLARALNSGAAGYEIRTNDSPAAYPVSAAMMTEHGLSGAAYDEHAVATLYDATYELMGAGLTRAKGFSPCSEDALRALLAEETLVYTYTGQIPASVLAAWMEGSCDEPVTVSMAALGRDGTLILRTREQGLLSARTTVDKNAWARAARDLTVSDCAFAGVKTEEIFGGLAPETLVFEGIPAGADVLVSEIPAYHDPTGSDSIQTLLQAFDYSQYARSYEEKDAEVYVNNGTTLRIGVDGTVRYTAASAAAGEEKRSAPAAACVEEARLLLDAAQYSIGASTQTELLAAEENGDGRLVIVFGQQFDGIPIVTDRPFARFEYQDGRLLSAVLHLRRYSVTGERRYLLPETQAAAAADPGARHRLCAAYLEDENGRFVPERCYLYDA